MLIFVALLLSLIASFNAQLVYKSPTPRPFVFILPTPAPTPFRYIAIPSCPKTCTGTSTWSAWSGSCPTKCGGLTGSRTRTCQHKTICTGTAKQTQQCRTTPPCDCVWGQWSAYSPPTCDGNIQSCGDLKLTRRRYVSQKPSTGGDPCVGPSIETKQCDLPPCQTVCECPSEFVRKENCDTKTNTFLPSKEKECCGKCEPICDDTYCSQNYGKELITKTQCEKYRGTFEVKDACCGQCTLPTTTTETTTTEMPPPGTTPIDGATTTIPDDCEYDDFSEWSTCPECSPTGVAYIERTAQPVSSASDACPVLREAAECQGVTQCEAKEYRVCAGLSVSDNLCRALLDCPISVCCDGDAPLAERNEAECPVCKCDNAVACVSYAEYVKDGVCRLIKRCVNARGVTLADESSERDGIRCVQLKVALKPNIETALDGEARLWQVARSLDATANVVDKDGTSATVIVPLRSSATPESVLESAQTNGDVDADSTSIVTDDPSQMLEKSGVTRALLSLSMCVIVFVQFILI